MPHATASIPRKVFWLTTRTLLLMKQMHTPPAPPTDAPPSAQERRGQQRQQRWSRRQHCQATATAATRQGAQPLAGAAGEAHASFPVRAVDVLSEGAADVRPQRHAAEGLHSMGESTRRNTESTVIVFLNQDVHSIMQPARGLSASAPLRREIADVRSNLRPSQTCFQQGWAYVTIAP
jgi:hypothetical protein